MRLMKATQKMWEEAPMSFPAGDLKVAMKPRHLVMMSFGSAIGAGLFMGFGAGIATAGPAVLLSYVVSGAIVLAVMRMLGKMVADDPNPGASSYYADRALGSAAGFAIGWLWWIEMGLVVATEATTTARYLSTLIPGFPQRGFALIIMVVFMGINPVRVGGFGEFEFWFSLIKITFVVVFLVLGVAFLLGFTPAVSLRWGNLLGNDFMPHGIKGVASALLVVIFAFGGVEIVAMAVAETADPERSIRKVVDTVLQHILILYMGAVTIMLLTSPWNDPSFRDAPFVAVLNVAGLSTVAAMTGTMVVVALLPSFNANLYGGSRIIFSLAKRRMGPAVMRGTNARGVPVAAVLVTSFLDFVAAALSYFQAEEVLKLLLNMVGSTMIVIWLGITASHLVSHRRITREGNHSLEGFPVALSWTALVTVAAVVALGFTVPEITVQLSSTFALTALLAAVGGWLAKRAAVPGPEGGPAIENGM